MYPFNPDLKLGEATYNNDEHLGIRRLDKARQTGSKDLKEFLNSAVVYAYGSNSQFGSKNFPILWNTQGMGKKRAVKSIDGVYYNYLFGKPKKTSTIAKTIHTSNGETGRGGEEFVLVFRDRFFQKNQIIHWGGLDGIQVQIGAVPIKEGAYYRYKCRIFGGKASQSVPFQALQAGAVWAGGVIKVSLERSRGTEHRSYSPYEIQNQLSIVRQSLNVAGNSAKKVMNFTLNVDGKNLTLWYEWERYLTEMDWNEKKDMDLLTSRFNKDADGVIVNFDADSTMPVPSGAGIWDQIPSSNELVYTEMTESKLRNFLTDILNITQQLDLVDKNNVVIDILGGFIFLEDIDNALKRSTSLLTPIANADHFIKSNDTGLTFGNYFTAYKHISGAILRFGHHRGFDYGAIAESAPRHPRRPGFSIMSGNAIITNFGLVNVDSSVSKTNQAGNLEYVYEDGREYIDKLVLGMAHMPEGDSQYIASDIDASARHMMCSQGVHAHYPMSMGKIVCNY